MGIPYFQTNPYVQLPDGIHDNQFVGAIVTRYFFFQLGELTIYTGHSQQDSSRPPVGGGPWTRHLWGCEPTNADETPWKHETIRSIMKKHGLVRDGVPNQWLLLCAWDSSGFLNFRPGVETLLKLKPGATPGVMSIQVVVQLWASCEHPNRLQLTTTVLYEYLFYLQYCSFSVWHISNDIQWLCNGWWMIHFWHSQIIVVTITSGWFPLFPIIFPGKMVGELLQKP